MDALESRKSGRIICHDPRDGRKTLTVPKESYTIPLKPEHLALVELPDEVRSHGGNCGHNQYDTASVAFVKSLY